MRVRADVVLERSSEVEKMTTTVIVARTLDSLTLEINSSQKIR